MNNKEYKYRHLARFIIEAVTPLTVGTGEKDFITDASVLTDTNGLPYIPGTSIAGVIRHAIGDKSEEFFGFNDNKNPENSMGSKIIFTNAIMIGKDDILEGLKKIDFSDPFYSKFKTLPIRQHNRINHKGVVEGAGKFDEQVSYKGARFCFEIEKVSKNEIDDNFNNTIDQLFSKNLRLGGGTRSGFGEIIVISWAKATLNLQKPEELEAYINKSSSLTESEFWKPYSEKIKSEKTSDAWLMYELKLKPDDFFLFGSGFGNDDADMTPVKESIITWDEDIPEFKDDYVLIPATSVKGALSHRVAFHYNKLRGIFADHIDDNDEFENHVGDNNPAVRLLFGRAGEKDETQEIGNVMISDVLLDPSSFKEKILNHVAIDRFTGGAIDGALFQEEVLYGRDAEFTLKLLVNKNNIKDKVEKINSQEKAIAETDNNITVDNVIKALESALEDICTGMLPLGGGVNRGHGSFEGEMRKNGETFKLEKNEQYK